MMSISVSVFVFVVGVSIAAAATLRDFNFDSMLKYEKQHPSNLKHAVQDFLSIIRKPHVPERYTPVKTFENLIHPYGVRLLSFSWKNCGKPTDLGQIKSFDLGPDPIYFPGDLDISFTLDVLKEINAPLLGALTMERKVGSQWIKIPCIGQIGSCSYDDLCALLADVGQCPSALVDHKIPCKCPYQAGTYTLPMSKFELSAIPFPAGDYRFKAVFSMNETPVGCYTFLVTIGN